MRKKNPPKRIQNEFTSHIFIDQQHFQTQNALQGGDAELIGSGNNYDNTNVNQGEGGGSGY